MTGHVPPGFANPRAVCWMTKAFNEKFIDIVLRHARVIVAMHFGHEHHDSFRLFYDHNGKCTIASFLSSYSFITLQSTLYASPFLMTLWTI